VATSRPASDGGVSNRPSSGRAIENLIATYAQLVDAGDFAGIGGLLADATFSGASGTVHGADAIVMMLRDRLIVYDDGTPRTKHSRPMSRSRSTSPPGRRGRGRTSLSCRPRPIWHFSRSSAVATTIVSSAAKGDGALRSGASSAI
jgi:hypothetical protein